MYQSIYVPLDNSDWSNQAAANAVRLGKAFGSTLTGCHVYAAKMHDYRFKQMEYSLPAEYLEETELERQRKIHDSLITMGLKLISDSYLAPLERSCVEQDIAFEARMMDGKHTTEMIRDIHASDYDLVMIGALGMGKGRDSQIGSVAERVARYCPRDTWIVRNLPRDGEAEGDTILVGVDGSPQSFYALTTAVTLAKEFGKKVEAIGVYDPYLHYQVFNSLVGKLTEKAAKVFRFEEQNQLHEEIIDTGLAQIYQSHLNVAEVIANERGVQIEKTLLDGKAFQKILDHARKSKPWLLVMGRVGIHAEKDEKGLGSNTENLLRQCPCDLLLTTGLEVPKLDVQAEESILWTTEAEARLKRVPVGVVGIARTAILRLAVEQGHSVITNSLIDLAMDRFMPKDAAKSTTSLAESMAFEAARQQRVSICKKCGVAATLEDAVKCTVCGGVEFEVVTPEMIDTLVKAEGGAREETTYDGKKLRWTKDARRTLLVLKDHYKRRRAKARIEKSARTKHLETVTLDFARQVVEEETGLPLPELPDAPAEELEAAQEAAAAGSDGGKKIIARDAKKVPLISTYDWTDEAAQRVLKVPGGFMRDRTQSRVEELAAERKVSTIDLKTVEDGIAFGREMMEQMIGEYGSTPATPEAPAESKAEPKKKAEASGAGKAIGSNSGGQPLTIGKKGPVLNEVGVMSDLAAMRLLVGDSEDEKTEPESSK